MMEYFLWAVSFISLFVSIFWINVFYLENVKERKLRKFPNVSIVIPAYNEENAIEKTVDSVLAMNYPNDKIEVIVVNDDSKDNTRKVVESMMAKGKNVLLINRKKKPGQVTKAPALNEGLKYATGEFVACLDADTTVEKDCLEEMLPLFDEKIGAVISVIKVNNIRTFWTKLQRLEYIMATFVRKLMSKIETLHVTPGALSLYKTRLIRDLGGFDENNITEDLEIAMRLHYNGYKVRIATNSITHTNVPESFKGVWNQRVRWFRGFIHNSIKYKEMVGKKEYGWMGTFQYPMNLISFTTVILMFGLVSYEGLRRLYDFVMKLILIKTGIFYQVIDLPSIKEIVMGLNVQLLFPITIAFMLAFYIYYMAHKSGNEKWRYPSSLIAYITFYPVLRGLHWVTALTKETSKSKREW